MRATGVVAGLVLAVSCQSVYSAGEDLYDETMLRTLKLTFSQANWWTLLTNNYQSKTNLPATLTVDGVVYEGVGVRFRGNTSYQMIGASQKKSFNIEIDYTVAGQKLMGYDSLNLLKWEFPEGTQIGAGGYLLVWADEHGGDSPGLHANFKLSSRGETLWLFDTAERRHALLDSVSFGPLEADQALGRYPDAQGLMQVLSSPTPLGTNAAPR